MIKSNIIIIVIIFVLHIKGMSQEFRVMEDPIIYYTYDRYEKIIYYRDFFTGEIYKTGIDSIYREYFLPDEYTDFKFFNNSHKLALLRYIKNQEPMYELYFFDFVNDILLFKNKVSGGISISPSDENILLVGDEPSYYSIIDDTVMMAESNLFIDCCAEWKNDSSFYFIRENDLYQYSYSTSSIDTLIAHGDNYDRITSIGYNYDKNILAYGYFSNLDYNNQLILMDVLTGNKKVVYDLNRDDNELSGMAIMIKNIKWSPDYDKIAFFLRYYTLPASDIRTYNCEDETWTRYTNWDNNYGVKYNLQWINQDTILYENDSQIYGFDLKGASSIKQSPHPETHEINISNYPNPFNTSTKIEVALPQYVIIDDIFIDIYNINGQRIQQLRGYKRYNNSLIFIWDIQNRHYLSISSGVYLLKIKFVGNGVNNIIKSHKVILIK
jgi:hypothetical protein